MEGGSGAVQEEGLGLQGSGEGRGYTFGEGGLGWGSRMDFQGPRERTYFFCLLYTKHPYDNSLFSLMCLFVTPLLHYALTVTQQDKLTYVSVCVLNQ